MEDAWLDARFCNNPMVRAAPYVRFYAGIPLVNAEGAALGALCVADRRPRKLTEIDIQALQELATIVMAALELRRARSKIHLLATTDPLTGLLNRTALFERLEREKDVSTLYILNIDLDNFKEVNDCFGHRAGDLVLQRVAAAIRNTLRKGDTAARTGGDEFVVLLIACTVTEAMNLAERLRMSVERSMQEAGHRVTTSIGISPLGPGAKAIDDALTQADVQMYRAKTTGGNRVCVAPAA